MNRRSHRIEVSTLVVDENTTGSLHDLLDRVRHVLGHLSLVLADAVIDVQQRHAVLVDALRVDGNAVVRVRQRLTKRMDFEPGGMAPLDLSFQRSAKTRNLIRSLLWAIPVRPCVPELRAESAQVVATATGSMIEARHIN